VGLGGPRVNVKNLLPDDDEQTGRLSTTLLEDHREKNRSGGCW
jgi:hypothetical protein